jgi:DNA-binding NtrC family response regulator
MLGLFDRIKKAAVSDANILIQGEAGSGNECIALLLHQESPRAGGAFLARSCTAIPSDYFSSEMFGHKSLLSPAGDHYVGGAFLGADRGTLFLDEIGDLGYCLQTELFLAIREKTFCRMGGLSEARVNPRIICSSSRPLLGNMKGYRFRNDLYYEIATIVLKLAPLREQREEIVPLARHFAGEASGWLRVLTPEAEQRLLAYDWPGNIRELRTIIDQAVIMSADGDIQASHLKFEWNADLTQSSLLLADVERNHILSVIRNCKGNKTVAARALGLARSTLVLKLKTHSLISAEVGELEDRARN